MDFSSVRYFKKDKSNTEILVWRVEKTKKVSFALGFCCLDAVSLRGKENDKEYFSVFWRFLPPFLPSFALGFLGIG